ncbi:MAG: hypothetical protein AMR96_05905 [Candidatus Adiutrix intracellularis]|nr:MAG: hypothetical protein AMR96_05905 [Candidatus Adiutrix intracellularis]
MEDSISYKSFLRRSYKKIDKKASERLISAEAQKNKEVKRVESYFKTIVLILFRKAKRKN